MDIRERFASNLKEARGAKGISQEELGDRCDLHRTAIGLLERGEREPEMETMLKLAAVLDTTLDELCTGIAWEPKRLRFEISRPK